MTYLTNYDTFKEREVSKQKGKVDPYAEYTNNTPELYKLAGQFTATQKEDGSMSGGLSPERLQAATEKLVTSPTNNPLVAGIYDAVDGLAKTDEEKELYRKSFTERLGKGMSKKVIGYTKPNWDSFKAEDIKLEEGTKRKMIKDKVKDFVKKYEGEKGVPREVKDFAKENRDYRAFILNAYKDLSKNKNIPYDYLEIKYERDPKVAARIYYKRFGAENEEAMKMMKSIGFKPSSAFRRELKNLTKNKED